MKNISISNIQELQLEILRLNELEREQRLNLGYRFSSPAAIFATGVSLFPKSAAAHSITDHGFFQHDFFSLISRILVPLTLNKTIFRRSGFLIKLLVGLVSQKVAGYVTDKRLEKVFEETKSIIEKLFFKNNPKTQPLTIDGATTVD